MLAPLPDSHASADRMFEADCQRGRAGIRHGVRPIKRGEFWYFARRVPVEFKGVEHRRCVVLSTKIRIIDDPNGIAAKVAVENLDRALAKYWRDLQAGKNPDEIARYRKAQMRAQELGFSYLSVHDIATSPLRELAARLGVLVRSRLINRRNDVVALLGGAPAPRCSPNRVPISELVSEAEASRPEIFINMSASQKRRWRSTRALSAASLVTAIGYDKPINDLSRQDALAFRQYWVERVMRGEVLATSANKRIAEARSMYCLLSDAYQLDLPPVFERLLLRREDGMTRRPFSSSVIQERILAEGALAKVNAEARRILFLMVETGLRPSEACNLTRSTIILDHAIPHIQVRPEGRILKTKSSKRDIPLVGVALGAMRAQPDGFPRYRDKSDALSALLNKVLAKKGFRSSAGEQTLYSLRHSFSDRLRNAKAPDSTVNYLMGHAGPGPRYGEGISPEAKLEWLSLIAFKPPSAV